MSLNRKPNPISLPLPVALGEMKVEFEDYAILEPFQQQQHNPSELYNNQTETIFIKSETTAAEENNSDENGFNGFEIEPESEPAKTIKMTTNKIQIQILIAFMEKNRELCKGYLKTPEARQQARIKWENVTKELNAAGPPERVSPLWKKVWSDYKTSIKKKLADNKKEQLRTGGGRYRLKKLSSLEEKVVGLISIDKAVDGLHTSSFGVPAEPGEPVEHDLASGECNAPEQPTEAYSDNDNEQSSDVEPVSISIPHPLPKRKSKQIEHIMNIQSKMNEQLNNKFDKLIKGQSLICKTLQEISHTNKLKLKQTIYKKRILKEKMEIKKEMLRMKQEIHQLKLAKLRNSMNNE